MATCGKCGHAIIDEECDCPPLQEVDLEDLHIPHDPSKWIPLHRDCEERYNALEAQLTALRLGVIQLSGQARFMSHNKMEKELMKLLEGIPK